MSLKPTPWKPDIGVWSALYRLLLVEFNQKTEKLGQNLCLLYRECPFYGVSVLERFCCSPISQIRPIISVGAAAK